MDIDIHKVFDDKSNLYAQARPQYPPELYEWLISNCPATQSVWDVGCGSGQAAIDLRNYFDWVEATDVSSSQIKNAPTPDRVNFSVQKAEQTNFAADSFDAVCVAQALHWFDYTRFWPEVLRVLKPQGVFCAWGYTWPHIDPAIDDLLERCFLAVIRPYWASQNKFLWDGYVDIALPFEIRLDVPEIELSMDWSMEEFFAYLHSWSATRRCMEDIGESFFQSGYAEISEAWGGIKTRRVVMDFVSIAGKNPL